MASKEDIDVYVNDPLFQPLTITDDLKAVAFALKLTDYDTDNEDARGRVGEVYAG